MPFKRSGGTKGEAAEEERATAEPKREGVGDEATRRGTQAWRAGLPPIKKSGVDGTNHGDKEEKKEEEEEVQDRQS